MRPANTRSLLVLVASHTYCGVATTYATGNVTSAPTSASGSGSRGHTTSGVDSATFLIGGIISIITLSIACFAFTLVVLYRRLEKSRYEADQNRVLPEPTEQSPCNTTGEQDLETKIPIIKTGEQDLETCSKQETDLGPSVASKEYDSKPMDLESEHPWSPTDQRSELSTHQQVTWTYPEVLVNAPPRGSQTLPQVLILPRRQLTLPRRLPPVHSAEPGPSEHSSIAGNPAAEIKVEDGHAAVKKRPVHLADRVWSKPSSNTGNLAVENQAGDRKAGAAKRIANREAAEQKLQQIETNNHNQAMWEAGVDTQAEREAAAPEPDSVQPLQVSCTAGDPDGERRGSLPVLRRIASNHRITTSPYRQLTA